MSFSCSFAVSDGIFIGLPPTVTVEEPLLAQPVKIKLIRVRGAMILLILVIAEGQYWAERYSSN